MHHSEDKLHVHTMCTEAAAVFSCTSALSRSSNIYMKHRLSVAVHLLMLHYSPEMLRFKRSIYIARPAVGNVFDEGSEVPLHVYLHFFSYVAILL